MDRGGTEQQSPPRGNRGKRFSLSFLKKEGGQRKHFATIEHARHHHGCLTSRAGVISPRVVPGCGGSGDAINPPKKQSGCNAGAQSAP